MPAPSGWPHGVSIGLGAFLLFQVELIAGKLLLPWFGGAPAVWTTCMLFFQVALLAGYGYAHALADRLSPRVQRNVHLALLLAACALLAGRALAGWPAPVVPGETWKPGPDDAPVRGVLMLLAMDVGLPFLALAATGPLVSAWSARARPDVSPYRLYALSNAGSLLGLLSYPILVEPWLPLSGQGWPWSIGFAAFAVVTGLCALAAARAPGPAPAKREEVTPAPDEPAATRPGPGAFATWWALSAIGAMTLIAVTNQLCQDMAAGPLLWMLPLALYLLTFIACFQRGGYPRTIWTVAQLVAAALAVATLHLRFDIQVAPQIAVWGFVLLANCMVCHGELARARPRPRYLTHYYLTIAAGGAAGAAVTALLAPRLFLGFWELHLAVLAGVTVRIVVSLREPGSALRDSPSRALARGLAFATVGGLAFGLVVEARTSVRDMVYVSRNFFGVLRVTRERAGQPKQHLQLKHGRIVHGLQHTEPHLRRAPTTYYGPRSGVGLALAHHPRRNERPLQVGVIGLGTGTLAAYARPGDRFRFYEIDPAVIALSAGPDPLFTYVADAGDSVTVVAGDARLSLERQPSQAFDVLAVDAFSSDAIPVHLLTREAVAVYLRHLRAPDGILALHVSNRYLDLPPVVAALAAHHGLHAETVEDETDESKGLVWSSTWMLLCRQRGPLEHPKIQAMTIAPPAAKGPLWTDAHTDLVRALKW